MNPTQPVAPGGDSEIVYIVRTLSDSISRVGLWDGRPLQSGQLTSTIGLTGM